MISWLIWLGLCNMCETDFWDFRIVWSGYALQGPTVRMKTVWQGLSLGLQACMPVAPTQSLSHSFSIKLDMVSKWFQLDRVVTLWQKFQLRWDVQGSDVHLHVHHQQVRLPRCPASIPWRSRNDPTTMAHPKEVLARDQGVLDRLGRWQRVGPQFRYPKISEGFGNPLRGNMEIIWNHMKSFELIEI